MQFVIKDNDKEENNSNGFYRKMGGKLIKKRDFKLSNQTLYENLYFFEI